MSGAIHHPRNRGSTRATLAMTLAMCAGLLAVASFLYVRSTPRSRGPLVQQAYVWQHAWSDELLKTISHTHEQFSNFLVLTADVSFDNQTARIARVDVDFRKLHDSAQTVGLVIHVEAFSGSLSSEAFTKTLTQLAGSILVDASAEAFNVREVQIDFDCSDSQLDEYRTFLTSLRATLNPTPVTFTAPIAWIEHPDFPALAKASDGFVLRLHALKIPTHPDGPYALIDPESALLATESAAKFGVPFRVALPTYGGLVASDASGNFLGFNEDGPSSRWPENVQLRTVQSDPPALARIVRNLEADRPLMLYGIAWYRLSAPADQLNWKMQTLAAVMKGHEPLPDLHIGVTRPEQRLWEIWILNTGDADARLTQAVHVTLGTATLSAADALTGFDVVDKSDHAIVFKPTTSITTLAPEAKRLVGWVRVDEDVPADAKFEGTH